jgi:hypothetical protein
LKVGAYNVAIAAAAAEDRLNSAMEEACRMRLAPQRITRDRIDPDTQLRRLGHALVRLIALLHVRHALFAPLQRLHTAPVPHEMAPLQRHTPQIQQ